MNKSLNYGDKHFVSIILNHASEHIALISDFRILFHMIDPWKIILFFVKFDTHKGMCNTWVFEQNIPGSVLTDYIIIYEEVVSPFPYAIITYTILWTFINWKITIHQLFLCHKYQMSITSIFVNLTILNTFPNVILTVRVDRWYQCLIDDMGRHRTVSTLAQVLTCFLKAPSHVLSHCLLTTSKVQWDLSEDIIIRSQDTNQENKMENCIF